MEKMKALYEKVAGDSALQAKFEEIMNKAEAEGTEVTEAKLVAFAKDAGFEVSMEDVKEYFEKLSEENAGELTEGDLDMVAGGKSLSGIGSIFSSIFSLGVGCAIASIVITTTSKESACGDAYR